MADERDAPHIPRSDRYRNLIPLIIGELLHGTSIDEDDRLATKSEPRRVGRVCIKEIHDGIYRLPHGCMGRRVSNTLWIGTLIHLCIEECLDVRAHAKITRIRFSHESCKRWVGETFRAGPTGYKTRDTRRFCKRYLLVH